MAYIIMHKHASVMLGNLICLPKLRKFIVPCAAAALVVSLFYVGVNKAMERETEAQKVESKGPA